MTSIDELMEDKLDRLERENAQLRADKQELLDVIKLTPYAAYFQEMMR